MAQNAPQLHFGNPFIPQKQTSESLRSSTSSRTSLPFFLDSHSAKSPSKSLSCYSSATTTIFNANCSGNNSISGFALPSGAKQIRIRLPGQTGSANSRRSNGLSKGIVSGTSLLHGQTGGTQTGMVSAVGISGDCAVKK
ncbi:unnamed protein product [Protopolystoma xenopodis]|uniref:Uncharacterized protein n=1 Tax=Protopolystoma xenopodis TaxID=117903 RepID=A0A448WWV5_9PLAT|nr:unnamed protein product [Protopolystoma xenopodis]